MKMTVSIPINIPYLGKEEQKAVLNVLQSGILTSASNKGGTNVQEFEKLVCKFVNSKFAVAVNSGTAALQAAIYASGIKRGDEIIIPSFTFVATANAVASIGARPVFADIMTTNFTIDPKNIEKKITKRTKCIMPVHLYGNICEIDLIKDIAKKHNLTIIEDAAQSMGSIYKNKHSGTFSDLGCYSLYPAKVMTSGEGGIVVTNDKKLYEKLLMIRNHGMVHGYDTTIFGLNLRMPEISAAIARIQIKKLPDFIRKRRNNAKVLSELMYDLPITLPIERKHEVVNWYLYTIVLKKRDQIMKKLNSFGIGAMAYYSTPIHKTPLYKCATKLPNTEWASANVLSLPVHPKVTETDLHFISDKLRTMTK